MTTLKPLNTQDDIAYTRTLLHEAIPLTGTIISGTYEEQNIKNYSHGMFQSVFDYPYLSSSANHLFDVTVGVSPQSGFYPLITTSEGQKQKKRNIYNQMSQVAVGYDVTGGILQFDEDGDIIGGGSKVNEAIIIPFSRLLTKDEIRKQTFQLELGVNFNYDEPMSRRIIISDVSASTEYRVNSPVGEYGILYATQSQTWTGAQFLNTNSSNTHTASINGNKYWYAGLIYYQAGIVVLSASVFGTQLDTTGVGGSCQFVTNSAGDTTKGIAVALTSSQISSSADGFRNRIYNMQFNNTTELNSTVYFCRANHNEFNYSSNPTYTQNSKIRVKLVNTDDPVSFITTVGLYNDNNELMATAKLSEPLKKTPQNEFTLRVRLDY
jgi:hypothetical protein